MEIGQFGDGIARAGMTIDFRRHAQSPFDLIRQQFWIAVWNCDHCLAARLQHSLQFLEKRLILFQMFKHIDGDNAIELPVRDLKVIFFIRMDWFAQQLRNLIVVFARDVRPGPFTAVLTEIPVERTVVVAARDEQTFFAVGSPSSSKSALSFCCFLIERRNIFICQGRLLDCINYAVTLSIALKG